MQTEKKCSRCQIEKPITDFGPDKRSASGLKSICRSCDSAIHSERYALKRSDLQFLKEQAARDLRRYYQKKKRGICHLCGKRAIQNRAYCRECGEKRAAEAKIKRLGERQCIGCGVTFIAYRRRRLCDSCAECTSARFKGYQRDWRQTLKREAFTAYGGSQCACCGEREYAFLTLDHINNDGAAHRKLVNPKNVRCATGVRMYAWLKRKGYPPGFQVLCMNCNFGKKMNNGICPHQQKSEHPIDSALSRFSSEGAVN